MTRPGQSRPPSREIESAGFRFPRSQLSSFLFPHSSFLIPLSSFLFPHSSFLIPLSSFLFPHSSFLVPLSSFLDTLACPCFTFSRRFDKLHSGCKATPVQTRGGPATVDGQKIRSRRHCPSGWEGERRGCEPGNLTCNASLIPRGPGRPGRDQSQLPRRGAGIFL